MDADMKTYFFNQVVTPVPAGHPTADQIEECLTDLLGNAAGGPETFPTTVGPSTTPAPTPAASRAAEHDDHPPAADDLGRHVRRSSS